ncbi:hypothetical protein DFA_10042 [Cavenderia fasciculata]|uniref:Uncharacterized protein n=1 Tax=Cavenderia fasciculata TaxID=261658 RepID=F4Q943_CACFS|nr:uncharacterized protein DFA_10042 [Cavenderia fasciculata]EGG15212.1 hypothetical protein DFA_10042 [Cavenderia fasciculata]|eukprot:XP_004351932.1 hypothetical protein DFA_10042 [Cavenderia fasciculata]
MTEARTTWLSGLDVAIVGNLGVGKHTFIQSFLNSPIVRAATETPTNIEITNQLDNHVKWNYQFCNLQTKFNLRLKPSNTSKDSNSSGDHPPIINQLICGGFYNFLNILFILFDVTNLQSFENLKDWYDEANQYSISHFDTVIVGTKRDLVDQRKITREQANDYALGLGSSYFEVGQDDDDGTCIDRVYSIITKHLYENICKDMIAPSEKFLYLELDSISSPPQSTKSTTTTIKDQLFYSVYRLKYIQNNIFKQITKIHSDLNVHVVRGIGMPNIEFWCTNRYINVLKYYQKTKLPIEFNCIIKSITKLSSILRMPNNLELLQYIVENIGRNLKQKDKNRIMNEVMVGGDLSMVQYLYSQEYYWTNEGLRMAITFNHLDIIKFIIEKSGDVKIKEWFDLTDQSLEMCIGVAKSYNRKEIENILKKKQSLKFKLSNMFKN